jgi:hypothetical protein
MRGDEEPAVMEGARGDLKILLDRGYRKDSALAFVGDHHHLGARARNRLLRETFSELEIADTQSKLVSAEDIAGKGLVVDGFNVLITLEALITGGEAFLCQDGMVRDNAMAFANYRIQETTEAAADGIVSLLCGNPPKEATWVFDSQISGSGRLAEYVRRRMEESGLRGRSMTCPDADAQILRFDALTATSDTPLIRRLEAVVDLPQAVLMAVQAGETGEGAVQ